MIALPVLTTIRAARAKGEDATGESGRAALSPVGPSERLRMEPSYGLTVTLEHRRAAWIAPGCAAPGLNPADARRRGLLLHPGDQLGSGTGVHPRHDQARG